MDDGDAPLLGCCGHEQIGHLASSQAAGREEALDLQGAADMGTRGLDWLEDVEGSRPPGPLVLITSGEADLEVTDRRAGDLPFGEQGFDGGPDRRS